MTLEQRCDVVLSLWLKLRLECRRQPSLAKRMAVHSFGHHLADLQARLKPPRSLTKACRASAKVRGTPSQDICEC